MILSFIFIKFFCRGCPSLVTATDKSGYKLCQKMGNSFWSQYKNCTDDQPQAYHLPNLFFTLNNFSTAFKNNVFSRIIRPLRTQLKLNKIGFLLFGNQFHWLKSNSILFLLSSRLSNYSRKYVNYPNISGRRGWAGWPIDRPPYLGEKG